LEDRSEVEALMVEGRGVRLHSWELSKESQHNRPQDFEHLKGRLFKEIERLERKGPHAWTEYQVVPLFQMLVDFLPPEDVIARTRTLLAELEDYASDSAFRYESRNFERLKDAVDSATLKIDNAEQEVRRKNKQESDEMTAADRATLFDSAQVLRAELSDMYDHLAGYQLEWAHGSALIRGLLVCGAVAVVVFLGLGTMPWYYFSRIRPLELFDWAYLGAAGSITSLLLTYYKYRLVEVGNTEGKQELLRATLAGVLGFVAGLVSFSIVWFDLIDGKIVPNITSQEPSQIAGSIVAAIGAGFVFESVFEKLKQSATNAIK
jgi:hypothetical protein